MFGGSQIFTSSQGGTSFSAGPGIGLGGIGATQDASKGKQRREDKQTCLPVTIRLLNDAVREQGEEGDLRVHGKETDMFLLVAAVETLARQMSNLEMMVNDGTGRIRVRAYSANGDEDLPEVVPGRYVAMFGNVRTAPALHFVATGLRLIRTADEVSYHMIEVAHAALRVQRAETAPLPLSTPKKLRSQEEVGADTSMLVDTTPPKVSEPFAGGDVLLEPAAAPVSAAPRSEQLTGEALKKKMFEFVKAQGDSNPEGVKIDAVTAEFKLASEGEVREGLRQLVEEGELFNSLDDDHFAVL